MALREVIPVNLRFDVFVRDAGLALEALDLYLVVEVTDVTHDGLVLHPAEVLEGDDVPVACRRHVDVGGSQCILQRGDCVPLHGSLQSADGIDLSHGDPGALCLECSRRALTDIAIAADDCMLSGDHHICGPLDSVHEGLPATIQIVKLGFSDGVVHVDCREEERAILHPLIQPEDAGRRLLRYADDGFDHLCPSLWVCIVDVLEEGLDGGLLRRRRRLMHPVAAPLQLETLVDEEGRVATIIHDQLGAVVAFV